MTQQQQQPQQSPFTLDELMAASASSYGLAIGSLTTENLLLKKRVAALETALVAAEAKATEQKQERDRLVANAISYEDRIHALQDEVAKFADQENIINSRA